MTREEECLLIAQFLAERGAKVCPDSRLVDFQFHPNKSNASKQDKERKENLPEAAGVTLDILMEEPHLKPKKRTRQKGYNFIKASRGDPPPPERDQLSTLSVDSEKTKKRKTSPAKILK